MSTIPASQIVSVLPSVLGAGGSALDLNGLVLTESTQPPIGSVLSFPTALAVASYFGASSKEATIASRYFAGFAGATATPGAILFAQYPGSAVAAYLRSASVASLSLSQLQALSGSLTVVFDGYSRTGAAINLAAASSFSSAASLIQTGLNGALSTLATFVGSIAGSTMTVTGTTSGGPIAAGQTVAQGTVVAASTIVVSQLSGTTGGTGTYQVSGSQTTASGTLMTQPTPVSVLYDSVSGGLVITSGLTGTLSTSAYATGSLSASLSLTQVSGAVLSQGAAAATPTPFMNSIVNQNQNWALFMTAFNPDSAVGTNTNKLLFAAWTSAQSDRYAYVPWDTDPTPMLSTSAPSSLGAQIVAAAYAGIFPVWEAVNSYLAAFVLGIAASIDFSAPNGRTDFDFRSQAGIVPGVTDSTTAANLEANGYNFYGAYATANQGFEFLTPGSVSGPFQWMDSFVNQVWLNAQFQLALMELITTIGSIPYNQAGYTTIENALATPIQAGLAFGAFRAGVALSSSQILEVNSAAGANVAPTLQQQGWYLQVLDPGPTVRAARGSPIVNFWYTDGQDVQRISMASIAVQ